MKKHLEILKDMGLANIRHCSVDESEKYRQMLKEKKPLPESIFEDQYGMYEIVPEKCTQEDVYEYLLYGIYKNTKIIKGCVIFFTVLMVIAIVVGIIALFNTHSYSLYY